MQSELQAKVITWDSYYPHYSIHSNLLIDITDSLFLGLSSPTSCIPTRYLDNNQDLNSVLDLMFLRCKSEELDNHSIYPKWHLTSDHTPLTITISIIEEQVQTKKQLIVKGSKEEKSFINDLIKALKSINMNNLSDVESLKNVINSFTNTIERTWGKNAKIINITKHSKSWWNANCSRDLKKYKLSKRLEDWK